MNFLLDPKLQKTLIDQLEADGHYDLITQLEQLPAILPGSIFTQNRHNSPVPIVRQA